MILFICFHLNNCSHCIINIVEFYTLVLQLQFLALVLPHFNTTLPSYSQTALSYTVYSQAVWYYTVKILTNNLLPGSISKSVSRSRRYPFSPDGSLRCTVYVYGSQQRLGNPGDVIIIRSFNVRFFIGYCRAEKKKATTGMNKGKAQGKYSRTIITGLNTILQCMQNISNFLMLLLSLLG